MTEQSEILRFAQNDNLYFDSKDPNGNRAVCRLTSTAVCQPIEPFARNSEPQALQLSVKKTARRFSSFSEAEEADRDFYKNLTGNQRVEILVELLNHGPEQRLERVSRTIKFPRR
jgi:hypothetical protein